MWKFQQLTLFAWSFFVCVSHAKSWLIGKDSDAGRDWESSFKIFLALRDYGGYL